jgi:fumarylpyruvate hydrolase
MSDYIFEPPAVTAIPIVGETKLFPVRRIFCVGRNYADHVAEMGGNVKDTPPVFFCKPADAIVMSGATIPYPPRTTNLHYEIELVVALKSGGANISEQDALSHIFGCAVGNDLTRRDLQGLAKKEGSPWDMAKGFDHSAVISPLVPGLPPKQGRIYLSVNNEIRQDANLAELIWSVPEIIATLSTFVKLCAGDLIYTGTPAGVGALVAGDHVRGGVEGIGELEHWIG